VKFARGGSRRLPMEPTARADSSAPPIRAVIFDFGGVLCFNPTDPQIANAARTCGLEIPEFLHAFWSNREPYDAGLVSPQEYWQAVAQTGGIRMDEELIHRMIAIEIDFWTHYDQRVIAWVDELRASGIPVGILSNLPLPLGQSLRESGELLKHFDHVTFSYELRVIKPQAEIYEDAIRGLRVPVHAALFIDDKAVNVDGARAAGLNAELYTHWETFAEHVPERYALPPAVVARRQ
jgi:putative hydrolase of the HAD superfamily